MKRQFTEFTSAAGTPHKVPVPTKKQSKCRHEMYGSYAFDMMKLPTCLDCGKEVEGKRASDALAFYKKLIDDANSSSLQQYERTGTSFFYVKNSDGSYRQEYKTKSSKGVFGILYDVFVREPRDKVTLKELGL